MKQRGSVFSRLLMALLLVCLFGCQVGCASTTQEMAPPVGELTLHLGSPEAPAVRSGAVLVMVGCQVGITSKPVGVEALNPLLSAAPNVNSPNSSARAGDVKQEKLPVVPEKRETVVDVKQKDQLVAGKSKPKAKPVDPKAEAALQPGIGFEAQGSDGQSGAGSDQAGERSKGQKGEEDAAGTAGGG